MRKRQFLALFGFLIFIVIFGHLLIKTYKINAVYGTIKSVHASLLQLTSNADVKVDYYFDSPDNVWRRISTEIYDELIVKLHERYNLDTPKRWTVKKPLLDPWGNRLQIWYKYSQNKYIFKVVSVGPDCKSGTKDDIISEESKGSETFSVDE